LLQRGIAAADAGDRESALEHFERAAHLDPKSEVAWLWLGSLADDPREAIEHYRHALAINASSAVAKEGIVVSRLRAGIVDAQAGNVVAARTQLRAVVKEAPNQEAAWHWLASVAESPYEARDCLRAAVRLNRHNRQASESLRQIEEELAAQARTCPLCGKKASAPPVKCSACGALVSLATPDAFLEHVGANVAQMKAAEAHYEKVVARGGDFTSQFGLALASLNLKRWAPAFAALQAAIALAPSDRVLRKQLDTLLARKVAFEAHASQQGRAGHRTVMVVDDSPTVRKLVAMTLENEGYQVVAASDGYAAADSLRNVTPDLILLDIVMPGIDGYQLCKIIKGQAETAKVPVIMLSGKDGFFDKIRGRMAGSTEYVTKPFDPASLLGVVGKHCGAKK